MKNVIQDIVIAFLFFFLGYVSAFMLPVSFIEEAVTETEEMNIEELAEQTVQILSDNDLEALSEIAHSDGVTFAPYGYFTEDSLTFTPEEIANFYETNETYTWGNYDGSGEPIELTYADYQAEFIYNVDYQNESDEVVYEDIESRGNSLYNFEEFFSDFRAVEFYQAGQDPSVEGLDWSSLILIFQDNKLRGVAHGQWTI